MGFTRGLVSREILLGWSSIVRNQIAMEMLKIMSRRSLHVKIIMGLIPRNGLTVEKTLYNKSFWILLGAAKGTMSIHLIAILPYSVVDFT